MKIYGLTGGIACGKSTVTRMLRDLGAAVIDADKLARLAMAGPTLASVAARFPQVIGADGVLDRPALGRIVFSDKQALADLNAIVHPRIEEMTRYSIQVWRDLGEPIVFYDNALIFELGHDTWLDGVIVVTIPEAMQLQRLCARNQMSEVDARARMAAQLPLAEKVRRATHVIDNISTEAETQKMVSALHASLKALG